MAPGPTIGYVSAPGPIRIVQREPLPTHMLQPRTLIAAATSLFLAAVAPAHAAEAVSPHDIARFLAGMPPAAESPLAALTKEHTWQEHARNFDSAFQQVEQSQLARIRAWSASNITASRPTVFYMFSGPDFLY